MKICSTRLKWHPFPRVVGTVKPPDQRRFLIRSVAKIPPSVIMLRKFKILFEAITMYEDNIAEATLIDTFRKAVVFLIAIKHYPEWITFLFYPHSRRRVVKVIV